MVKSELMEHYCNPKNAYHHKNVERDSLALMISIDKALKAGDLKDIAFGVLVTLSDSLHETIAGEEWVNATKAEAVEAAEESGSGQEEEGAERPAVQGEDWAAGFTAGHSEGGQPDSGEGNGPPA